MRTKSNYEGAGQSAFILPGANADASAATDNRASTFDAAAVAHGMADTMKLNYQKPGKKATTILSPHLETIDYGSMIIVLDNSTTSLPIN